MFSPESYFDLGTFDHADLFNRDEPVWSALPKLKEYMASLDYGSLSSDLIIDSVPVHRTVILHEGKWISGEECSITFADATKGKLAVHRNGEQLTGASVLMAGAILCGRDIRIGNGVLIESGAFIKAPAVIGDRTEVRQGAYLRGHCLVGKRCVVGHVTEVKHALFLDDAKAGHFAYIGDSILGNRVNLGAGTKLANLRFTGGSVMVRTSSGNIDTGLKKLGAIMGDDVQTGCNSVTNPGTVMGRKTMLMPNTTAPSGYHPPRTLIR